MKLKKLVLCLTLISSFLVGCGASNKTESIATKDNISNSSSSSKEEKENIKISVASVSISEVLAEMGQEIVGRPTTKMQLPAIYEGVSEIGSSFSPDFEKILAVETELLIGDEAFKSKIEKTAKEHNIETFYVNTSTYEKFIESIEELGKRIKIKKMKQKKLLKK